MSMLRKLAAKSALGAIGLSGVLLLAGCYELNTRVTVKEDGSVAVSHLHVVDPGLWGDPQEEQASNYVLELYSGFTKAIYEEKNGWVGYRFAGGDGIKAVTGSGTSQFKISSLGDNEKKISVVQYLEDDQSNSNFRGSTVNFLVDDAWEITAVADGGGFCIQANSEVACQQDNFGKWTPSVSIKKKRQITLVDPELLEPKDPDILVEVEPEVPFVEILPRPAADDTGDAGDTGDAEDTGDAGDAGGVFVPPPGGGYEADSGSDLFDDPDFAGAFAEDSVNPLEPQNLADLVSEGGSRSNTGMWVGLAGGGVLALALAAVFVLLAARKKRETNPDAETESAEPAEGKA